MGSYPTLFEEAEGIRGSICIRIIFLNPITAGPIPIPVDGQ